MNPILKKLGLTNQNPVLILNAPEEYHSVMAEIPADIHTSIQGKYAFIQLFAENMAEAVTLTRDSIGFLTDNGHFWLCYPKGTSKKYKSDLNRDKSWEVLVPYQFEPVTLVALDADWSAMRFKPVDDIKEMKRKNAATTKGKERIQGNEG